MNGGYCDKVARIDLTEHTVSIELLDERLKERYIGGRGFIARWLVDVMPVDLHPLDPQALLAFATGPLTAPLCHSSRTEIGAGAPETGIFSDRQCGREFWTKLKRAVWSAGGDRSICKTHFILISDEGIELKDAVVTGAKMSLRTNNAIRVVIANHACPSLLSSIRREGVAISTIMVDRVRSAGRGGLGAVMGSKNLKAVAVYGSGSVQSMIRSLFGRNADVAESCRKEYFATAGNQAPMVPDAL